MPLPFVKVAFKIFDKHSQHHNYNKQNRQKHIHRKLAIYRI